MKKTIIALTIILLATLDYANAQTNTSISYFVGGGWSHPMSPSGFTDTYDSGYGLEVYGTAFANCTQLNSDSNFMNCSALGADIGYIYNRLGLNSGLGVSDGDMTLSLIRANARLRLTVSQTDNILTQLYFTGGYNRHFLNVSDMSAGGTSVSFESESGNGFNYGAGITAESSGFGLYLQYSMYNLIMENADENLVYGGLTFGIKIYSSLFR